MNHKLGICIPYRNRKEHLKQLVPHLTRHLNEKGINHKFYVGHQVDTKLLNRGTLKNIAAEYAFRDGCDYIAWHDVDMLPREDCDYSYPEEHPIHIATKLSKYNYGISYEQYFGGVVLFTKEQVNKTNGYSNEYWDWGQEDDDLFWRCYYEGYTTGKVLESYQDRYVANFNGLSSFLALPVNTNIASCLNNNYSISILFKSDKVPIWLVGDKNKRFIEYPILRKDKSWTWGLSFNNSRAITMLLFDKKGQTYYNWGKRFEELWTWVRLRYSKDEKSVYFYINDELITQINGTVKNEPLIIDEPLQEHSPFTNLLIGYCPQTKTYFKGQVAEIKISNDNNIVLHYDFNDGIIDKIGNTLGGNCNVTLSSENVDVIENILPHRREGSLLCLDHKNEGFVNGTWAKGETTARNEKRLVTEMQQRKIDYKNDGMNSLKYKLISEEKMFENCLMINVKL